MPSLSRLQDQIAIVLTMDTKGAVRELDKLGKKADASMSAAATKTDKFATSALKMGTVLTGASVLAGVGLFKAAQGASDLSESINKTNVVFGKSGKTIVSWSKDLAKSFGLSQSEALEAAGAFGNMFRTTGIASKGAATMSQKMVTLAADMASFNNEDPSEMLDRLRSGLAGEAEPLRRFGVLLSEARVKTFAYNNGIAESGAVLTEAQKVQARYGLILKDTKLQQGDFGRTASGAANQQRILNAEMKNLSDNVGKAFLPVLKTAVTGLSDLAGGFNDANSASGGLVGKIATFATLGGGGLGGILLITGGILKLKDSLAATAAAAPRLAGALRGVAAIGGTLGGILLFAQVMQDLTSSSETAADRVAAASRRTARESGRAFIQMAADARSSAGIYKDEVDKMVGATARFRELAQGNLGTATKLVASLRETPAAAKAAGINIDALAKILKEETKAQRQSASDTERGASALEKHKKAAADDTAAIGARQTALIAAFNSEVGAAQATKNLAETLKGTHTPLEAQAGLLNAAGASAQAATDNFEALNKRTATSEEKANFFKLALLNLANQFPELRGQVDQYLARLAQLPEKKDTHVHIALSGVPELDTVINRINAMRDKDVTVTVHGRTYNVPYSLAKLNNDGTPDLNNNPNDSRATGGPVRKGKPYLVGENGPEMFIPGASGKILSHADSMAKLTAVAAGSSGGGGSVYNINFNGVVTNPAATGRELVRFIKEFERGSGKSWRG